MSAVTAAPFVFAYTASTVHALRALLIERQSNTQNCFQKSRTLFHLRRLIALADVLLTHLEIGDVEQARAVMQQIHFMGFADAARVLKFETPYKGGKDAFVVDAECARERIERTFDIEIRGYQVLASFK